MSSRETLLAYYKRWRGKALAKMVPGQYADTYNAAKADVAHYDMLISRLS